MSSSITTEEYKSIKIREALRPYLNTPRYEQMTICLTSRKQAMNWEGYQSPQQKKRFENIFSQIESLRQVTEEDKKLVELQLLMRAKSKHVQFLFTCLPYQNLIAMIVEKNGEVTLDDLRTLKSIHDKIIDSQQFLEWKKNHNKTRKMDIEQEQRFTQHSRKRMSFEMHSARRDEPQQEKIHMDVEQKKIQKWLSRIYQENGSGSGNILEVQILNCMKQVFTEKVRLNKLEKMITDESRWDSQLQEFFKAEKQGDPSIIVALAGVVGYLKLRCLFELVLPINLFELEERCQLSHIRSTVQNALLVVGNTGVGKTTFILSLLGYKHIKEKDSYQNINLTIERELQEEHKRLQAGSSSVSITTHLTSIPFICKNKYITLIDTPGFEDTRGPLTDIANQVMLEGAYEKCQNTTYIILSEVKKLQVERYKGVKELALNIAKRFQYSSLEELQRFVLLIFSNKFNEMTQRQLHNLRSQSRQFLGDRQFESSKDKIKNKIALQLVIKSLNQYSHFFDPLSQTSIEDIKQLISRLGFQGTKRLKTYFQNNTNLAIKAMAKLLKKNLQSKNSQISKMSFYYSLLYKMNSFVPNFIKDEKAQIDQIIQEYANRIFQKVTKYLKQRLESKNYQQAQFDDFTKSVQQLECFQILANYNPNIKSQKDINYQFQQFQNLLRKKISEHPQIAQISEIFRFIHAFQPFSRLYCPQISNSIETLCLSRLVTLQSQSEQAFKAFNPQKYSDSIENYGVYENLCINFYDYFKNVENFRFKTKNQLLSKHLQVIRGLNKQIIIKTENIMKSLQTQNINKTTQIQQLNRLYQEYEKYQKFHLIYKQETRQIFRGQLNKIVQNRLAQILKQFQGFIEFPKDFPQKILHQNSRVTKLFEFQKSITVQILKKEVNNCLQSISKAFNQKLENLTKMLKQINRSLNQKVKFKEPITQHQISKQIEVFETFKSLAMPESVKTLTAEFKSSKLEFKQFCDILIQMIQDNELLSLTQAEYFKWIEDIKMFESFSRVDIQSSKFYHNVIKLLHKSIGTSIKKIREHYTNMKFSNFQELKQKFNKAFVDYLRKVIFDFIIPTQTIAKQMTSTQDDLITLFFTIKTFFVSMQQLVNKQNIYMAASKKLETPAFKDTSRDYTSCLGYIYSLLRKEVNSDKIITKFLLKPYQFVQISEGSLKLTELERAIQENYMKKIEELRYQINDTSLTHKSLPLLSIFRTQCSIWKDLEDVIRKQNRPLYQSSIDHFNKFIQLLQTKIAYIEKRQLNKIQCIIDKETNKVVNTQMIEGLYNELRNNAKSKVSPGSQQNFQHFLQKLQMAINVQIKQIKVKLMTQDQTEMSYELINLFQDQIELYEVLSKSISFNDIKECKINFIQEIKKSIDSVLKKIGFFWKFSVQRVKKLIDQREFLKAKKMILVLQNQRDLVSKVQETKTRKIQNHQQEVQFFTPAAEFDKDIQNLNQKLQSEEAKRELYLQNPFQNQENLGKLIYLYKSQSVSNQQKLKKKMRQQFNKKFEKFKEMSKEQYYQFYNQICEFLQKLPEDIAKDYNWFSQLQAQKNKKDQEEKKQLAQIACLQIQTNEKKKQLFDKYEQKKNYKFKNEVTKKIRQIFSQSKAKIKEGKILKEKLEQFEQFYKIYSSASYQYLRQQMGSTIQDFEDDIFNYLQGFAIFCYEQIQKQLRRREIAQKQSQLTGDTENGVLLYSFAKSFQRKKHPSITKIIKSFFALLGSLAENFETNCPFKVTLRQLNANTAKIYTFRWLFVKINTYEKLIASTKEDQLQKNMNKLPNNPYVQQSTIEAQQYSSFDGSLEFLSEIDKQIKLFKGKLKERAFQIYHYLEHFIFADESLYNCKDNQKIKQKVQQLAHNIQLGLNSAFLSEIDKTYVVERSFIEEQKRRYNQQFNKFLHNVLKQYGLFLNRSQQQTPTAFNYAYYLTQQINTQSKLGFLKLQKDPFSINSLSKSQAIELDLSFDKVIQRKMNYYSVEIKRFQNLAKSNADRLQANPYNQIKLWKQEELRKVHAQKKKKITQLNSNFSIQEEERGIIKNYYHKQEETQIKRINEQEREKLVKEKSTAVSSELSILFERIVSLIKIRETAPSTQVISLFEPAIKQAKSFIQTSELQNQLRRYIAQPQNQSRYAEKLKKYMQLTQKQKIKKLQQKNTSRQCDQLVSRISRLKSNKIESFDYLKKELQLFNEYMDKFESALLSKKKQLKDIVKQADAKNQGRIKVLAAIAAVMALPKAINTQRSLTNSCEFRLHPVQIIVLLLLTKDNSVTYSGQQYYKSMLAEMKIGEGKSLVVAVLATFYALRGEKVSVACYSSFLTALNRNKFSFLFEAFKVTSSIFYGTFYQVCQNALVIDNQPIREIAKTNLLKEQQGGVLNRINDWITKKFDKFKQRVSGKTNGKPVLLFDDIDMLFEQEYLETSIKPILKLRLPEFSKLLKYVWGQINSKKLPQPRQVQELAQYCCLVKKYPSLKEILRHHVNAMLTFAYRTGGYAYYIYQNELFYQNKEKCSSPIYYAYQTIFSYLTQYQDKKIDLSSCQNELVLPVILGQFTYAQILKNFKAIQGVSGTLSVLEPYKLKLLSNIYEISPENMLMVPSLFRESDQILSQYIICDDNSYYRSLCGCLQNSKESPVVVCFQNYQQMRTFQESSQFKAIKHQYNTLHFMKNTQSKQKIIAQAGEIKSLTLMTSENIWGLDIQVNSAAADQGGLHLILAYIPDSQAQFSQLIGRTGRLGQLGSIYILFNTDQFIKKRIRINKYIKQPQKRQEIQDCLKNYWKDFDQVRLGNNIYQLNQAKQKKWKGITQGKEYMKEIFKANQYKAFVAKKFRIVIAINGMESMKPFIKQFEMKQIFQKINRLKQETKTKYETSIQIMTYNNYSSQAKILSRTQFQTQHQRLQNYLDNVFLTNDVKSAALEVLFRSINEQRKCSHMDIDMLFVIGNVRANNQMEIEEAQEHQGWKEYIQKQVGSQEQEFFLRNTYQQQTKHFPKRLIINGLSIQNREAKSILKDPFFDQMKQLSNQFQGETRKINMSHQNAHEESIKFITINIMSLLLPQCSKQQIEKMYLRIFSQKITA